MNQSTSTILMIRPVNFGFNDQTALSNTFQSKTADEQHVQDKALAEFDAMVNLLKENKVDVIVINDTEEPHKPDSIFPNNWVSFHENGDVFMYPMQAENRRLERREDVIRKLEDNFKLNHIIDLSRFELQDKFLEGTGSMVLDRENKLAYACLSPRTDAEVLNTFCKHTGYTPVTFNAVDSQGKAIYHTNVMMCVGSRFAVACLDSIPDTSEKEKVMESIKQTGKELVSISADQLNAFTGNMLELKNQSDDTLIVMSARAYRSLNHDQINTLEKYGKLINADISTIENNGGGGTRCMMAEVHLERLK
jgi:hypothetical protein